jgi:L,D-peptidoglycan transpeptidase YkuD (ErfK/YbiS/YcfS/YnhG family)
MYVFFWLLVIFCTSCAQHTERQLILVDSKSSKLQLFERKYKSWRLVSNSIPVVLGKNGVTKYKKEGDSRTPIGLFTLGHAFGISKKSTYMWPYVTLNSKMICVDNPKSKYYNQWIDKTKIPLTHWISGEHMLNIQPQYELGLIVNYNTHNPKSGAGSCVFLHVWNSPKTPTAGCIAMSKDNMQKVVKWLNPKLYPIIKIY